MAQKESQVSTKMVFKEFWRGIKPDRKTYFISLFLYVFTYVINIFNPLLYKRFFDVLGASTDPIATAPTLINTILFIALLHATAWITSRIAIFKYTALEAKTMANLRQNAFNHLILHSYNFFANSFSGSLVQRVNRFARAYERIAENLMYSLIPITVTIVGALIVTFTIAPIISLIIILWVTAFSIFNFLFSNWKIKYDIRAAETDSETTALLSDDITNNSAITLFNGYDRESNSFKKTTDQQAKAGSLSWNLGNTVDAAQIILTYLAEFAVFYYGVILWTKGLFTLGTFVLIQIYILSIAQQFWAISQILRAFYEGMADSKEMVEAMALPHEIKNVADAKNLARVSGKIEFKDVVFSFHGTRNVLDKLNLQIAAGEKVALVGPSGTGKTTLVGLLLRLYDPSSGAIFIDGQNIRNVTLESLRANISLVPQDPVLFHRTILENIRYGKPDATDKETIAAARLAHCDEFVDQMPLKYGTFVGERGIKLSGGERQRVAIARALLKNAPILVLDEATSSLDSQSEALIQDALDKLMSKCTTIAIAHRLSTIRKMDRIVVMDSGGIAEEGTHQGLTHKKKSIYKNLWTLQAGGFIK